MLAVLPTHMSTTKSSQRMTAYFTALKDADSHALTPQACTIVRTLRAHQHPMTRKELVEALTPVLAGSAQKPTRVIAFYKKTLLAAGFIRVDKRPRPVKEKAKAKTVEVNLAVPAMAEDAQNGVIAPV